MLLRASYLAMHRQTESHLADLGITADQFVCLLVLYDNDGIIQRELVDRVSSDQNTVRAMLVLLEEKGYVVRKASSDDGRARVVRLTSSGRAVTERCFEALLAVNKRIKRKFSAGDAYSLTELLTRLVELLNNPNN